MRADPRTDKNLLAALSQVAPGTALRAGIDDIIRAELGALIVIGDPNALSFLYSGGMRLDLPFTSQLLYELAKMDGAIILNQQAQKIVYANVQLMPDPSIASEETGTRHRTAERVAKQTNALVISISQQRETVTIFIGDLRYQLGEISDVLARTNQALGTLETYRQRLEQGLTRLTALEFQSAVMLDDVLVVVQRAEMTTRMVEEIERETLKSLYRLSRDGQDAHTGALAEALGDRRGRHRLRTPLGQRPDCLGVVLDRFRDVVAVSSGGHHTDTRRPVAYITTSPVSRPPAASGWSSRPASSFTAGAIWTITWAMAPAPIPNISAARLGLKADAPIHAPSTAGAPASRPSSASRRTLAEPPRATGATIARPSVVL